MTDQGKANYEGYREESLGVSLVSGDPLPAWGDLPAAIRRAWDAGALAVERWLAGAPVDEDMPGNEPNARPTADGRTAVLLADDVRAAASAAEPKRYALVEQMGHRSTIATVREVTFCDKPMIEVTDLAEDRVKLISPDSLYQVTWLTEDEARRRAKPWTARAITGGQQLAYDEDAEADEMDDPDDDADSDDDGERDTARRMDALDEAARLEDRL